jgi:GH24 family phage-related lysozyme (muramidase)
MIQTLGGLHLIQFWEGISLTSYLDVAGVPTIGHGHTWGVELGQTITESQAMAFLLGDLAAIMSVVAGVAGPKTTDRQFGAMVSLGFNIGRGGFLSSTVLRQHKLGNYAAAADAFLLWDKATVDGALVTVEGLAKRRAAERALYLTPDEGQGTA